MRSQTWAMGVLIFCVCLLFSSHWPVYGDADLTWLSAKQKLLGHSLQGMHAARGPDQQTLFHRGIDGNYYSKYPLLQELHVVPFLMTAWFAQQRGWSESLVALLMGVWPAFLAALFVLLFSRVCERLGTSRPLAYGISAILLFTTPLWISARVAYGEMLQAVLVVWLMDRSLRVFQEPRPATWLGLGLAWGIACNSKILFFLWGPGIAVLWWWTTRQTFSASTGSTRRSSALALVAGTLPGLALFFGFNWLRFGHFFSSGYGGGRDELYGFSVTPILTGLYGLLLSPGKGIILYAPCLLLCIWGLRRWWSQHRELCWLHVVPGLLWVLLIAHWWSWNGDVAWGPRLILPVLPIFFLPLAASLQHVPKFVWMGLALVGFGIQILGLCFNPGVYSAILLNTVQRSCRGFTPGVLSNDLFMSHFVPEMSPIVGHGWLLKAKIWGAEVWTHPPWHSLKLAGWQDHLQGIQVDWDFWFKGHPLDVWIGGCLLLVVLLVGAWLLRSFRTNKKSRNDGV